MLVSGLLIAMSVAWFVPPLAEKLAPKYHWSLGDWPKFGATVFVHLCILVMLQCVLRAHEGSWKECLGLNAPRLGRKLLIGLGTGILVIPVLLLINWAI